MRAAADAADGDGASTTSAAARASASTDALEMLGGDRRAAARRPPRASASRATCCDTGADITRAREELGFDPATSIADGLRAELEWVAERAAAPVGAGAA